MLEGSHPACPCGGWVRVGNGGRALVRVAEGGVLAVFLHGGAAKNKLPQQPTPTAQQRNTRYIHARNF